MSKLGYTQSFVIICSVCCLFSPQFLLLLLFSVISKNNVILIKPTNMSRLTLY